LIEGQLVISGLAFVTINLPIKFLVNISTCYEDLKVDTKCRKWCGLGS